MSHTLDFVVIGANKASTTSLFEYLRRHPEIALPPDKEAPFFSRDAIYARGWERYLDATFGSADPARRWGTVTPDYMAGSVFERANDSGCYDERTVPERMRKQLPDVRLIALLRDPVERALSHHTMAVLNGREARTFDQAVAELLRPRELERSRREPAYANSYVVWGEYGRILSGYFDVFPRKQILVAFMHDMRHAPQELLRRVLGFIDVAQDFVPDNLGTQYRVSATRRRTSRVTPEELQRTATRNRLARAIWRRLPADVRNRVDQAFGSISYRFDLWNREAGTGRQEMSQDTLARLRDHFAADQEHLIELLDMKVPWAG